jgi:hypothetical protein
LNHTSIRGIGSVRLLIAVFIIPKPKKPMKKLMYKTFIASLVGLAVISCQTMTEETPITQEKAGESAETGSGNENLRKGFGTQFGAFLIGSEEVIGGSTNVLVSPGAGAASFTLSPDGNSLMYEIRVSNTTNIRFGHLHLAPAGVNGPVIVDILGAKPGLNNGVLITSEIRNENIKNGLTVAQLVEEFKAGNIYVNIHTDANPGGELRGQISLVDPGANKNFTVKLSGANEVPAVMTDASGLALFNFNSKDSGVDFQLNVNQISSNILFSHIHLGKPGFNGGVVFTLRGDVVPGPFSGVYAKGSIPAGTLSGQFLGGDLMILKEAFRTGNAYVNVHTANFGSGELRGNF